MQNSGSEFFWFGFYLVFCVVIRAILASEPFPWQRYYHHLFTVALLLLILLLFCRVVYCLGTATSCILVRSFSPSISAHAHKFSVLFCYRGLFLYISQFFSQSSRFPVYIPGLNLLCVESENPVPASSTLLPLNLENCSHSARFLVAWFYTTSCNF
jgi:hypothetical protein